MMLFPDMQESSARRRVRPPPCIWVFEVTLRAHIGQRATMTDTKFYHIR